MSVHKHPINKFYEVLSRVALKYIIRQDFFDRGTDSSLMTNLSFFFDDNIIYRLPHLNSNALYHLIEVVFP